jgi:hypothetical protein
MRAVVILEQIEPTSMDASGKAGSVALEEQVEDPDLEALFSKYGTEQLKYLNAQLTRTVRNRERLAQSQSEETIPNEPPGKDSEAVAPSLAPEKSEVVILSSHPCCSPPLSSPHPMTFTVSSSLLEIEILTLCF